MSFRAIVVGTGGHARVVLSILAARRLHDIVELLDLGAPRHGEVIMGAPVVGSVALLADLQRQGEAELFLAIGDNALRRTWWERVGELGLPMPNLVSPDAIVDPSARLGGANVVCARAFIGPEAVLGENNLINTAAVLEHEVRIGSHCHLAPGSTVAGRCTLGDGCFLGARSTVIDRLVVSSGVTIGAGATVVRSIDHLGGVYVGTPARLRGSDAERGAP